MLERFFKDTLRLRLPRAGGIAPGLRHYFREVDGRVVRYHLRVEADGSGLLLCNAASACRLAPTGVTIAHHLLEEDLGERALVALLQRGFRARRETLERDVALVSELLDELADPQGRYPILNLDDRSATAHRRTLSAPLGAYLPAAPAKEVRPLLRRVWEAGIPQVVFVVDEVTADTGEAKSAPLVELIEHAEDLGLIAGVRCRGTTLAGGGVMRDLAQAGVDHVDLFIADPASHDDLFGEGDRDAARQVLEKALAQEVCPVPLIPLLGSTLAAFEEIAGSLSEAGIETLSVFAVASANAKDTGQALQASVLPQAAALAEEVADHLDLRLVWAPPVERDPGRPLSDQVRAGPRTGSEAGVRIEVDGAVIPPTGPPVRTGSILTEAWSTIWGHEAFRVYREAVDDPPRCDTCPGLALCSAGCPSNRSTCSTQDNR